ncbi:MAG: tRNA modification GTPase TrmE [Gemmataceae bacterium]|nr:tRNA modification GTPase TrmE [Gemmataceae bacterium]
MTKTRIGLLVVLFMAPWVFLIGVGSYHLWDRGWLFWAWWPMFLCFGLSYYLAYRWTRRKGLFPPTDTPPPNYWTERDKAAWEKVTAKAREYDQITPELLTDPRHYSDLTLDLATQVAAVYNPGGATPFDHLTIPEVLACAELVAADLDELVQKYIPGVHMLRVRDYKMARKAADWYKTGQNVYWAAATVLNPIEVGVRWIASRYALGGMLDRLQGNILLWFHTTFVHQLGRYLIEMNSGRLKVGVKRYREILKAHQEPPVEPPPPAPPDTPAPATALAVRPIGIAVLGPVKAGKSSLVNALLGKQAATVDTLPVPHIGVRYNLTLAGGQPVSVLDTAGYGQEGANDAEFAAAAEAAKDADLILFVTQATNPGRRPDVDLLDRLRAWFAAHPQLKLPNVVAVVNQIDLLSPKAEWSPPYNWQTGTRRKEVTIRECVGVVKDQLGDRVVDVVPVCAREGETFGIIEGLVPAIAQQLDDARGSAMLKAFDAEGSADQYQRLGRQLLEGGRKALGILWQNLKK